MPKFVLAAIVGAHAFFAMSASATDYGSKANTEIILIVDSRVSREVEQALLRMARASIDIMGFSQNMDAVGYPYLKSIRQAQVRNGVKVRAAFDWQISRADGDKNNSVKSFLTDPALPCPGEMFCAHPIEKLSSGVSFTDYVHEKIAIIDAGTPEEVVIVRGRGTTTSSSDFIDSTMIFRRIDPSAPYAGDDVKAVYESVYRSLKQMSDRSVYKIPAQALESFENAPNLHRTRVVSTAEQTQEAIGILNRLRKPVSRESGPKDSNIFRPESISVLSNDLYAQILDGKLERAAFANDNHQRLIQDIDLFQGTVDLTAYSFGPSRKLHDALVRFLKRGNTLNIYSNGAAAYQSANSAYVRGFPAYYTYESVLKLMTDAGPSAKIHLHLLQPDRAQKLGLATYVHRKQVLFRPSPDSTSPVRHVLYQGSDNYTYSAEAKNDEIAIRIADQRMSLRASEITEVESPAFAAVDRTGLKKLWSERPFWYACVRSFIKTLF
jgi:phosphatidylserine/phosphatidylglycerophosphate/cardiolipin synthase-like enzyme